MIKIDLISFDGNSDEMRCFVKCRQTCESRRVRNMKTLKIEDSRELYSINVSVHGSLGFFRSTDFGSISGKTQQ